MSGRRHPFRLRTLVQLLVLALVVQLFVLPQLGGVRAALDTVRSVSPPLLVLALVLEVGAIVAYAELTRMLLTAPSRPSLGISFGVTLSSLGVNHVVPGGAATTAAVNYRLLGKAGVPVAELGFALLAQAVGSAVVLNAILWLALLASIPVSGFHPLYATAAVAGLVVMVVFAAAVVALLHGDDAVLRRVAAVVGRLPRVQFGRVEGGLRRVAGYLAAMIDDPARLRRGVVMATANWLLDAAALWVCLLAFGHRAGVVGLLVAFGLAYVIAAIPITPGGLGVVEAVLIPTLVGFGNPGSVVAVGVVANRLVNFWLPIPAGLASYLLVEHRLASARDREGVLPVMRHLTGEDHDRAAP